MFLRIRSKVAVLVYKGLPRLCTIVPWPVHLRCRPSKSPRTSCSNCHVQPPVHRSPLHCWQPSIFGCWPSRVELPATGVYVGTVSGDVPHSHSAEILQSTADVRGRRRLRSASTSTLVVPPTRRATIGNRAFPAAASRAWNSLPTSVREIQSLPAFRRKLKTALFAISFPAD